jgi:hypothetical protein
MHPAARLIGLIGFTRNMQLFNNFDFLQLLAIMVVMKQADVYIHRQYIYNIYIYALYIYIYTYVSHIYIYTSYFIYRNNVLVVRLIVILMLYIYCIVL